MLVCDLTRGRMAHTLQFLLLSCVVSLPLMSQPARPYPYPVTPDAGFQRAVNRETRTMTGKPGPKYWQNTADYSIRARILPDQKRLTGRATIAYKNLSPDTLRSLRVSLLQNIHKDNAARTINQEVTGGYTLNAVVVNGERMTPGGARGPRYFEQGTSLLLLPTKPTDPNGGVANIEIDFEYKVPKAGISARMGYDTDSLFYLAYWYPQMLVFNDVVDWQDDQFLGIAEFYADFANYQYTVEMPDDWLVWGTGVQQNAGETLSDEVAERLAKAVKSDKTVRIVGPEDFGKATKRGKNGWLSWTFKAENVRDVAFLATRHSIWEAARTAVGGGKYAAAHSFWRESAFRWAKSVEYTQKSIAFLSNYTGVPYPWPHMTAVEAGGIIGGGMEYPMMTLIGHYNNASDLGLFGVHAHEEAHMWVPMIVNVDERRYSWMDEGTTSYHTDEAVRSVYPDSVTKEQRHNGYVNFARTQTEGELMRWSNFHYGLGQFGVASYPKPASILHMLKGVLGEEKFLKAFRTYLSTWAWKHPYPWDMFNTFSAVSGKNLDWYMRAWYYETWKLDQAVTGVKEGPNGTEIVVEDKGWVPMPVLLSVTRKDGTTEEVRISETEWLAGKTSVTATVKAGSPVTKVEIDRMYYFADIDRGNNVWSAEEQE